MIEYKQAKEFERGIVYKLLCESYTDLLNAMPLYVKEFQIE